MVKNDAAHKNKLVVGEGNWCETRWWLWLIILVSGLLLLCMLVGVIVYFCCGPKKVPVKEESKPLVKPAPQVEVQHARPTYTQETHHHHSSPQVVRHVSHVHQPHGYTDYHQSSYTGGHTSVVREEPRVIRYTDADYTRSSHQANNRYYH